MKNKAENNKIVRYGIMTSLCCVAMTLAIVASVSFSWFSTGNGNEYSQQLSVGKVSYEMTYYDTDLFYTDFNEIRDDIGEQNPDEFVPATGISGFRVGQIDALGTQQSPYTLYQDTSAILQVVFTAAEGVDPATVTDRLSFTSSNPDAVYVSPNGGTICAKGVAGETAVITVTAHDISDVNPRSDITRDFYVMVLATVNEYGFLPGGAQILRRPASFVNYSTVDTKLRMEVLWSYSDIEGAAAGSGTAEREKYSVESIFAEATSYNGENITLQNYDSEIFTSPVNISVYDNWTPIAGNGIILIGNYEVGSVTGGEYAVTSQNNAIQWSVKTLSLTAEERTALIAHLNDRSNPFEFVQVMVEEATAGFYYGAPTAEADYGDTIPAVTEVSPADPSNPIYAINALTVSEQYDTGSIRKVFSVGVRAQARQMKSFEFDDDWFDVYECSFTSEVFPQESH